MTNEIYDGKEALRRMLDGQRVAMNGWSEGTYIELSKRGRIVCHRGNEWGFMKEVLAHGYWRDFVGPAKPAPQYKQREDLEFDSGVEGTFVNHRGENESCAMYFAQSEIDWLFERVDE